MRPGDDLTELHTTAITIAIAITITIAINIVIAITKLYLGRQVRAFDLIHDQVLKGMCTPWVMFCLFILTQQPVKFIKFVIQPASGQDGLHVVNNCRKPPALGNSTFGRVISIIDIKMWYGADRNIRIAVT